MGNSGYAKVETMDLEVHTREIAPLVTRTRSNTIDITQGDSSDPEQNHMDGTNIEGTDRVNQFSDCWDIEDIASNDYIALNPAISNAIHLKNTLRAREGLQWFSMFGTQIVSIHDYKRWNIRILAKENGKMNKKAKVMIGIVDVDTINSSQLGQVLCGEFWSWPHCGYAIGTAKGCRQYGQRWTHRIGDEITIELNLKRNRYIEHNELQFLTNGVKKGSVVKVDAGKKYVLAVALRDDQCELQICD